MVSLHDMGEGYLQSLRYRADQMRKDLSELVQHIQDCEAELIRSKESKGCGSDRCNAGGEQASTEHTEHYKHEFSIPKYKIYKNGVKIGFAFPRHAHKHDESPYLYVPETLRFNKRKYNKTGISRDFYIFDVDKQHTINDKAVLLRFLS